MSDLFLTVHQAAVEMNVADGTVRMAVSEGRLPAIKVKGRRMIARSDMEEYLKRARPNGLKPRGRPLSQGKPAGLGAYSSLGEYFSQFTREQAERELSAPKEAHEQLLFSICQLLRGMSGRGLFVVHTVAEALYEQEKAEQQEKIEQQECVSKTKRY